MVKSLTGAVYLFGVVGYESFQLRLDPSFCQSFWPMTN
ncbi:uncharacterized protein METZ01_LOCUS317220, partial [marine metagenome]